jgi:hypothetical protein
MTNKHVADLIKEYDAGRRDDLFQLLVYHALYNFFERRGVQTEADDIADAKFKDEEALANGVEYLRRKYNANHLNA